MTQKQMPSSGFWLLVVVSIAVTAFFVWGFSTPRLDKIWELEIRLKTGEIRHLSDSDKDLFFGVFKDYPRYMADMAGVRGIDLLSANSDGLSLVDELLILRTEAASNCAKITLDVSGEPAEFPIVFTAKGKTWSKSVVAKQNGRRTLWLPKGVETPEFIDITRKNDKGKTGSVDVKVRFCD